MELNYETLVTVSISVVALLFSAFSYFRTMVHDRKRDTLDAFNNLQKEVLDDIYRLTAKEIESRCANVRSEEYKDISTKLARIEHFCVGVNSKIYDIRTVKRLAGPYLLSVYKKLVPLISKKREIARDNSLYGEFETMVKKIQK